MVNTPMTIFAVLATVSTFAVLAWVLWPLWQRRPGPLAAGVLALSLTVLALYRLVGTPAALVEQQAAAPADLQQALAQLRQALEQDPDQAEGWALLARSEASLGNAVAARDAYARAAALAPGEPGLLVDAAEARALADPQRRFDEQAVAWLQQALKIQPGHARGTWFLGVWQRQSGQPEQAARTWQTLLGQVDEATARSLRTQIDEALAEAGAAPLPAAPTSSTDTTAGVTVRVALDPDFAARARLRGDATVFVLARVPGGAPMPVAVERHRVQDLPLEVHLDDADSPMPTARISALAEVEVLARLSANGSANRSEEDLETPAVRVSLPATGLVELRLGGPDVP
jgi:cytochrome c-type biogenesis protein CcmH